MHTWRRNVTAVGLSQFFSIAGFSFAIPFAPFFIQEQLDVHDPVRLRLWVTAFSAVVPLAMSVFAPIWGAAADRYGRRMMLLRANLAACLILTLMGLVRNVESLVLLRFLQGIFTGTMSAAQAMVAAAAPRERAGLALGTLSAAVFSGSLAGVALGGVCAEFLGYRASFFISGGLLLLAALWVLVGTEEPAATGADDLVIAETAPAPGWRSLGAAWPILGLILAINFVRSFDGAWLALLVQDIHGGLKGAALRTGLLSATGSVAGLLAGPLLGNLADRIPPPRIGKVSALISGLLMIPQALARHLPLLFCTRFGAVFCAGGLDPVFQIWLSKVTPPQRRGAVFGWASSARSLGWLAAALLSGAVAAGVSLRATFLFSGALYLLLIPAIAAVVRYLQRNDSGRPEINDARGFDKLTAGGRSKTAPLHG